MRLVSVCFIALALVACAGPDTPAAPEPSAYPETGSRPVQSPGMPTPFPGRVASGEARLALDGEGLRVFAVPSGASRLIAFGQPESEAMRALERVLGVPPSDRDENVDCGARRAIWPDGLITWFAGSRFVGWSQHSAGGIGSASGLRVGMTRLELENAATRVDIAPSTLGTEFNTAGMGGLLDSATAEARVSHLWAGSTCIAR